MRWNTVDSLNCRCQVFTGTPRLSAGIPPSVPQAGGLPAGVASRARMCSSCNVLQAVARDGIRSWFLLECCISCLLMQLFRRPVASLPISANGWTPPPPVPWSFQCSVRAGGGPRTKSLWPLGGDASPSRLIGWLDRNRIPVALVHLPKWCFDAHCDTRAQTGTDVALHDSPRRGGAGARTIAAASFWTGESHLCGEIGTTQFMEFNGRKKKTNSTCCLQSYHGNFLGLKYIRCRCPFTVRSCIYMSPLDTQIGEGAVCWHGGKHIGAHANNSVLFIKPLSTHGPYQCVVSPDGSARACAPERKGSRWSACLRWGDGSGEGRGAHTVTTAFWKFKVRDFTRVINWQKVN